MNLRTIENERIFMNTRVSIKVYSDVSRGLIEERMEEAFSKFDYVVKQFTRFEETSELSKLNRQKEMKVSDELFSLVEFSLKLAKESDGTFDPTIIDLLETYGYKKGYDFSILDDPEKLKKDLEKVLKFRPSYEEIKLDKKTSTIKLQPKQKIELGATGKGYAIDLAVKDLLPLKNFIINAGGDIYASGHGKDKEGWTAGLQIVDADGHSSMMGKVQLQDQALASSGAWARKVKYFHHLLNPKTGEPVQEVVQTFVIAKTALQADAYSTLLFVTGEKGLEKLRSKNIEALIVLNDNQIYKSKKFTYTLLP